MILAMAKYHENLLKDSASSLLFIVKFFFSLKIKMISKTPNETFLRITRYKITSDWHLWKYLCWILYNFLYHLIGRTIGKSWESKDSKKCLLSKQTLSVDKKRNFWKIWISESSHSATYQMMLKNTRNSTKIIS